MSLTSAINRIQTALNQSQKCSTGLTGQKQVFGIGQGPSAGPEILATIYLDDPFFGFWYGHVLQHTKNPQMFVSQIVWTDKFINASNVPLLFQRFHYWIKDRLEYQPCTVQNIDDAYAETSSLDSAASALIGMIKRFDIDKRAAFEGSIFENDPSEHRIVGIYGFADTHDDNGRFPPVPMPMKLKVVGSPE